MHATSSIKNADFNHASIRRAISPKLNYHLNHLYFMHAILFPKYHALNHLQFRHAVFLFKSKLSYHPANIQSLQSIKYHLDYTQITLFK